MTQNDRDQTPADLAWVAERLERERPIAEPLELDRMKLQARTQARRGARSQAKGSVLKSRVAITAILMLGLVTGGTGTTLALDSGTTNAAQRQYGTPNPNPNPGGGVVAGTQEGTPRGGGGGQVAGATQSSGDAVQSSQQVAAAQQGDGSNLPFTGLAAVPLIVLGLALLLVGGMLYRSARRGPSAA